MLLGHLYDKEGNQMEWLSAMAEAYNRRAECFVDQYNNYSIFKGENYTIDVSALHESIVTPILFYIHYRRF